MIIPWPLLASLALATLAGVLLVRWLGQPAAAALDLVAAVAVPALIAARLASLAIDTVILGALPDLRSLLTLGAGLSGAAAVLVAMVAGARALRRANPTLATATIIGATAGLAVWSLTALLRGDGGGLAAPVPFGWPLPGYAVPRVPVAVMEAAALGWLAWWLARTRGQHPPARSAWLLASTMAALVLLGPALRPSLATVDRDVESLLAVLALVVAVLGLRGLRPSRRAMGLLTAVGGVVALLVGVSVWQGPAPDAQPPPVVAGPASADEPGDAAALPDGLVAGGSPTSVSSWDGSDLAAFAAARGRPVVVNLWASWCPPCHAEAPAVGRAARALADRADVIGILVDDDTEDGQTFVNRYNLGFPTVLDDGVARSLGYVGLPTTVVVRPDGSIAHREIGGVDPGALAAAVDRAG